MIFTSKIAKAEHERLKNAFPFSLQPDVEEVIKSLPFKRHILLANGQMHNVDSLIHSTDQVVSLNGELLNIPYRVYFNEPGENQENCLTILQRTILNCIFLRHHNGFVRQKRLEKLLEATDYFVIPYTFQLLGEYVIEILEILSLHIHDKTIDKYNQFIDQNKRHCQKTESRMISYWNEYYRRPRFPKLRDYIGKQIIDRIKAKA